MWPFLLLLELLKLLLVKVECDEALERTRFLAQSARLSFDFGLRTVLFFKGEKFVGVDD